ncbi:MAG TPA: aspartyl-phosphate phosphatase Spo0E family protein [Oscillospiraceae bacterium]|nr:aspartyl-phosphate phosphatase Spo0E family protein [Oscillospiraceae bacterium]
MGALHLEQVCKEDKDGWKEAVAGELEQERKKLYVLATNLGVSHPTVLKQSRYLDKLVFSAMKKRNHNLFSF